MLYLEARRDVVCVNLICSAGRKDDVFGDTLVNERVFSTLEFGS